MTDRPDAGIRQRQAMAYVYILQCADGSYYVGSTRSLEIRMQQHHVGAGSEYTRRRLPVELVWVAEYGNVGDAFFWEKRIQGWSRAKREALIRGDYEALPGLARKDFGRRRRGDGASGLDTPSPRGSGYSTNDGQPRPQPPSDEPPDAQPLVE